MNLFTNEISTSYKWFIRSLKKGDWVWLMIAIIIASSTVTVVKYLGETVQQSMLRKASESLGADLVIQSSQPIQQRWQQRAQALGLKTQNSLSLTTMALINKQGSEPAFQLVQLKGISAQQPLRGKYALSSIEPKSEIDGDREALTNNQIWVSPSLVALHAIEKDNTLTLGTKTFAIAGSVESSSSLNPMQSIAPQVMINLEELKTIGLIGPGSRMSYRLMVAGDKNALRAFNREINDAKDENSSWQVLSAETPSEDLGNSLDNAWLFLDLAALSAVMVAGMSILIASRFYLSRWKQSIALMRAFGAHNAKMNRLFAMQMTWIAASSSIIGVFIGYLISLGLTPILSEYFTPLVQPSPVNALLTGFFSGLLVLWTFAWQAFYSAINTSPMSVLKSTTEQKQNLHWFTTFLLLIGLISLMLDLHNLHWIVLGIVITSLVFYLVSVALLKLLAITQKYAKGWLKIALSNITREPGLVKIQLISVGMVLFVLMLMTFVRQDLMQNWRASLPADTPNAFAVNIQADQKQQVDNILADVQQKTDAAMVRGRLLKVNGEPLLAEQLKTERGKRLLRREANIAVLASLPKHNRIIQTLPEAQITHPKVSVEQSIAEEFGLKIGDLLEFNISGQDYTYQLASIRSVTWQSFQLNFFFILEPVEERILPISYISNFKIKENGTTEDVSANLTRELGLRTPGVLFFDVRKIMTQIQEIMDQAGWAVSALYSFTLIASIIVLFTATLANQQSRIQSWLLLRTLGAENSVIFKIGFTEFFFLGGLAGLFAASLAQISSLMLSTLVIDITPRIDITLWLTSVLLGGAIFFIIGLVTQWNYLKKSPQDLKRFLAQN